MGLAIQNFEKNVQTVTPNLGRDGHQRQEEQHRESTNTVFPEGTQQRGLNSPMVASSMEEIFQNDGGT